MLLDNDPGLSPPLSQQTIDRIKAEEQLRFDVRVQLEAIHAKRINSVFGFLNTNLGIFLLSSIFLSSFSWVYNEYKTRKDLRLSNQRAKTFLHYEIGQRLEVLQQLQDTISEDTKKDMVGAVRGGFTYAIRREYSSLSLSALLIEYETRSDLDLSPEVQAAIRVLNHFERYEDQLQLRRPTGGVVNQERYYYLSPRAKRDFKEQFLSKLRPFR